MHLIEPLGFQLDDRQLKRAGLDYWPQVHLKRHRHWQEYLTQRPPGRIVALSVRGAVDHWDFNFEASDALLFGPETQGLPPEMLRDYPGVRIPMSGAVRSLNLAVSVGIVLYEALRQTR